MSSDHRLLRAVAAHFVMGAILGAVFVSVILLSDLCDIETAIADTYLPGTTHFLHWAGAVFRLWRRYHRLSFCAECEFTAAKQKAPRPERLLHF